MNKALIAVALSFLAPFSALAESTPVIKHEELASLSNDQVLQTTEETPILRKRTRAVYGEYIGNFQLQGVMTSGRASCQAPQAYQAHFLIEQNGKQLRLIPDLWQGKVKKNNKVVFKYQTVMVDAQGNTLPGSLNKNKVVGKIKTYDADFKYVTTSRLDNTEKYDCKFIYKGKFTRFLY